MTYMTLPVCGVCSKKKLLTLYGLLGSCRSASGVIAAADANEARKDRTRKFIVVAVTAVFGRGWVDVYKVEWSSGFDNVRSTRPGASLSIRDDRIRVRMAGLSYRSLQCRQASAEPLVLNPSFVMLDCSVGKSFGGLLP